jgi:hypothetical protein
VQATPRDFGSIGAGQGEGEHTVQTIDATAREMAELQVNIAVSTQFFFSILLAAPRVHARRDRWTHSQRWICTSAGVMTSLLHTPLQLLASLHVPCSDVHTGNTTATATRTATAPAATPTPTYRRCCAGQWRRVAARVARRRTSGPKARGFVPLSRGCSDPKCSIYGKLDYGGAVRVFIFASAGCSLLAALLVR